MGLIVDTSVLIEIERLGLDIDVERESGWSISVVTVAELLVGVEAADDPDLREGRSAFVESVITWVPAVEVDLSVARRYASLLDAQRRAGRPLGAHDLMIAATAQVIGAPVLTRNRRHFAAIPGTRVDPRSG